MRTMVIFLTSMSVSAAACKVTSASAGALEREQADSVRAAGTMPSSFAHGVLLYVNAVNCEMNAEDAHAVDAFRASSGVPVEVVFVGVPGNDSTIARQIGKDLGLETPSRLIRDGELANLKSIGIARMPMAVMIKGKRLSTIVTGQLMPKTLELMRAEFHR